VKSCVGPQAEEVLKRMVSKTDVEKVEKMKFMTGLPLTIEGVAVYVQRSGYTGEDGFEVSTHFLFLFQSVNMFKFFELQFDFSFVVFV
jgi:glycine cleavage system aminomethyltransferase T